MKFVGTGSLFLCLLATSSLAQGVSGDVELSFGVAPFLSTDDDSERLSEGAYELRASVGTQFGDYSVFGDVSYFNRNIGSEDFDDYAPGKAGALGIHAGRDFRGVYAGAFVGMNMFQGDDASSTNGTVNGTLYGIEALYEMGNVTTFGQLGYADMVGDGTDTAFTGTFARVGVAAEIDRLTFIAEFEGGRSNDVFEDDGDWGEYSSLGVTMEYDISDRVIGTFGYDMMRITANDEDHGTDEYISLGIRIPFGGNSESRAPRNLLTTTYRPGLAAAWAENLD